MRGVRDDLKGVLVPVRRVAHEGRRHFALLDEILGRPSAKIDHSACGRFARQAGGLEDVSDHVEHQTVFSQVAVFRDADADGRVADRGAVDGDAGVVSRGDDAVLFGAFQDFLAEQMEEFPGGVGAGLVQLGGKTADEGVLFAELFFVH